MARKHLTQRERNIFVICAVMVVVYGGFNGVFKPLRKKFVRLEQRIKTKQRQLQKGARTLRKDKALQKQYDLYIEQFKQEGTNEQVMSSIISDIEKVAADLQIHIANLKPKKVKSNDYYNQFSVSLTLDSAFVDIVHFLHTLQSSPYEFNVEEVRFDKGAQRKKKTVKTRLVLNKILIP